MDWQEDGIILSVRKHGESSAILNVLTRSRGRHAGLVRGGSGKRLRGVLQPGNKIQASWRARLPEHLGNFTMPWRTGLGEYWRPGRLYLGPANDFQAPIRTCLFSRRTSKLCSNSMLRRIRASLLLQTQAV